MIEAILVDKLLWFDLHPILIPTGITCICYALLCWSTTIYANLRQNPQTL